MFVGGVGEGKGVESGCSFLSRSVLLSSPLIVSSKGNFFDTTSQLVGVGDQRMVGDWTMVLEFLCSRLIGG